VEIADSARKHGVADEDMLHVVRNAVRIVPQAEADRALYIGATYSGRLLGVIVLDPDTDDPVIIHADDLPLKFYRFMRN
jgi:hypothetical protein